MLPWFQFRFVWTDRAGENIELWDVRSFHSADAFQQAVWMDVFCNADSVVTTDDAESLANAAQSKALDFWKEL